MSADAFHLQKVRLVSAHVYTLIPLACLLTMQPELLMKLRVLNTHMCMTMMMLHVCRSHAGMHVRMSRHMSVCKLQAWVSTTRHVTQGCTAGQDLTQLKHSAGYRVEADQLQFMQSRGRCHRNGNRRGRYLAVLPGLARLIVQPWVIRSWAIVCNASCCV